MKHKIFLSIFIIFSISFYAYGYFVANESCSAFYPENCETNKATISSLTYGPSLGQMIADSASYFLKSTGDYQVFLAKVEHAGPNGFNYTELLPVMENAVKAMEMANDTYYQMVQLSGTLEYNPIIVEKLKTFNYTLYMAVNGLNATLFKRVEKSLKYGDVRGCYKYFYSLTTDILDRLKAIKADVEAGVFPPISSCWRLNQVYLEAELYGQYLAEVFMNLK